MALDPGAMGNLINGLRASGQEYKFDDDDDRSAQPSSRSSADRFGHLRSFRRSLAAGLRRIADRLEPGTLEPGSVRGA